MKKKLFYVLIILISAFVFIVYSSISLLQKDIKEFSSNELILEDDVHIKIQTDVISFKDKELCNKISKETGIDLDYILGVGYLADKFVESNLSKSKVKIKDEHILVNNVDYTQKLMSTGFVLKNNKPLNPEKFNESIRYVQKQNFKIYNLKSHKYHKLSCKYGQTAHNSVILPQRQLPKDSSPCKYCLSNNSGSNKLKPKSIDEKTVAKILPVPPLVYTAKYFKIILSDYTTNLKPSNECKSLICKEIVSEINNAESTIDMAVYGYSKVPAFEYAIKNAMKRGVKVRLIYDIDAKGENIYPDTFYLTKIIMDSNTDKAVMGMANPNQYTNSLMHDKFYIFDNKTVITGSANLGSNDMSGFNSNSVIKINSPSVANIYLQEFEQMFAGKFHSLKNSIPNKNDIILGDTHLSIWFSPKDNTINKRLIPLINRAKKYIYIPTFLVTEKYFADALIAAKNRGVDVRVIVDAVNAKSKSSKHQLLRDNGVLVKTENYAGKLHSKSIIIDDEYVVIGSMNFSFSANTKNDENLVIIRNHQAAVFYRVFFEYLWAKIYNYWLTHDVPAESIYSIGSCSDGIDNDYDGKIDMEDSGCFPKN